MTLLLATRNRHKVRELRRLLKGVRVRFLTLQNFPDLPPVREDGATFRANAIKKSVAASKRVKVLVLAEDSGLEVRALGGAPGVRSARYAGRTAQGERTQAQVDRANVAKLLGAMRGMPASKRRARYLCVMALAASGQLLRTFQGVCSGRIALAPAGRTGFGYDPVFIPRGHSRTMAELGPRLKDALSHRARAARRLAGWL